jgi:hypothetical protein
MSVVRNCSKFNVQSSKLDRGYAPVRRRDDKYAHPLDPLPRKGKINIYDNCGDTHAHL